MSNRYTDPTWEECPTCGEVVPAGSAFCPECGGHMDARPAPQRRTDPRAGPGYAVPPARTTPAWMPIVLGFGGAAIIGIAVLVVLLVTRGDPAVADATASPSPSGDASADPIVSAEPSVDATPSPTPSPTPRPALANRSIAEVRADGVELRTQPEGGGEVVGTLGAGSRVFVIGAPRDAAERWYRVAVVDGPYSRCGEGCPTDIGYVADGAAEADAALAPVELECPSSPMTAVELGALRALERLACYGGTEITLSGTLTTCFCHGPLDWSYDPLWLASAVSFYLFDGTEQNLWVRFEDDPEGPDDLELGDVVEVTVAMEHDAAPECRVVGSDERAPTRADVVLGCRTQLVVDSYEIIGHDDAIQP